MNSVPKNATDGSVAVGARPASAEERSTMLAAVTRHDDAKRDNDHRTLMASFHKAAFCEFKPAGIRIVSSDTIAEMYRRTLPRLSDSFLARRKLREWSNQNGLVREWDYPVTLRSGEKKWTKQLEIFAFADGLSSITSYRVRMNAAYSSFFVAALGGDFCSLSGIVRVPG